LRGKGKKKREREPASLVRLIHLTPTFSTFSSAKGKGGEIRGKRRPSTFGPYSRARKKRRRERAYQGSPQRYPSFPLLPLGKGEKKKKGRGRGERDTWELDDCSPCVLINRLPLVKKGKGRGEEERKRPPRRSLLWRGKGGGEERGGNGGTEHIVRMVN